MENIYQRFQNCFLEEIMFKQRPQKLVGDGYIRWCWPEWLRGRPVFPAIGEFMQRPWGTFKGSVKASVDTD